MDVAMAWRLIALSCAAVCISSLALAQQDVQITAEATNRVCAEIHHTTSVQAEAPTIRGPQDVTLNCRLIGTGGPTIAQLTPGEVCQRLTGSPEWYRGMGTQVFCRVRPGQAAAPPPRSFNVTQDDIAQACQRVHRNPQAMADPTTVGRSGLELNCRLTNPNGVTLARVSPEDVCETKFGTREWIGIAGSTSFLCKGTPAAQPDRLANKPPVAGEAATAPFNDVPLTPEAIAKGCKALHGASAEAAPTTRTPTPGYPTRLDLIINCKTGGGSVAHKLPDFCPKLSGTPEWYVTDFGRGTWMPGENVNAAPRLHVCRGPGPLQYHALADILRYCAGKGHRFGNFGTTAEKPPACFDAPGAPINVTIADVCRDVHRAGAYERRGVVYLCVPQGTPVVTTTAPTTPVAQPAIKMCEDCAELMDDIGGYERKIKVEEKRNADEALYQRQNEEGAKRSTGSERDGWLDAARGAAKRIEERNVLIADMKQALEGRKRQLQARRCADPVCRQTIAGQRPELAPPVGTTPTPPKPPEPTLPSVERPRQQPTPSTTENPSAPPEPTFRTVERTPPSTAPQTPQQSGSTPRPPDARSSASSPASSPCPDHEAELTNGKRVFHRLYVQGRAMGFVGLKELEAWSWSRQMSRIKSILEDPSRQAPASTTETLQEPSYGAFEAAMKKLQHDAKPCDEVTIYIKGHAGPLENLKTADAEGGVWKGRAHFGDDVLVTEQLTEFVKGFGADVSVTVIMDTCYGGGFAGKGNVTETNLVQLIGVSTTCPSIDMPGREELSESIAIGVENAAGATPDGRATAREVKDYMKTKDWPLGSPFDAQAGQ